MADAADAVLELAKRRGFLWPSFEAYGGVAGFYDYGPLGAAMKQRFEDQWRLTWRNAAVPSAEIRAPRVTPHEVLKASGHVDEFTDFVVRCANGHPNRADHLIEGAGYEGNADALDAASIDAEIKARAVACPHCGDGHWTAAAPMNLMNATEIGPGSGRIGYLRPETAQGIFTDFPHLLRHFRGKLPFAGLQLGASNRNEISPRQGMLRLREFNMMEAEVFFADTSAAFPALAEVAKDELHFVPADGEPRRMPIGAAVQGGLIANEALGYFIGLTHRFLVGVGMDPERIRFRQHEGTEMAHYARDCWDAEFQSERYGWVECVGIADRGCYDLDQHRTQSGKEGDFSATVPIEPPITLHGTRYVPDKGTIGRTFKAQAKVVLPAIDGLFEDMLKQAGAPINGGLSSLQIQFEGESRQAEQPLEIDTADGTISVPSECLNVEEGTWTIRAAAIVPSVIEPSFGVDRILYALWEHAYESGEKNGEPYVRLRLAPRVAPIQAAVLPLFGKDGMDTLARDIEIQLRFAGLRTDYDDSGSIGRRYARADEVGTPVCITVDHDSLKDGTVTLRDRDTGEQQRHPIDELAARVHEACG